MNTSARLKICGLTRRSDLELAAELGAWALGFILVKESPRYLELAQLEKLLKKEIPKKPLTVAVFANPSLQKVSDVFSATGLSAVQLHGEENADFCQELRAKLPQVLIIKALRLKDLSAIPQMKDYLGCDAILLDTFLADGARGGTGIGNDLKICAAARNFLSKFPTPPELIVAGGIGPDNVVEAFQKVAPYAFDVSSRIEEAPGIKNESKMRLLFEQAKTAARKSP